MCQWEDRDDVLGKDYSASDVTTSIAHESRSHEQWKLFFCTTEALVTASFILLLHFISCIISPRLHRTLVACALFLLYLELLPIVVILRKLIITIGLNFLSRYLYRARSSHNSHVNCTLRNCTPFSLFLIRDDSACGRGFMETHGTFFYFLSKAFYRMLPL